MSQTRAPSIGSVLGATGISRGGQAAAPSLKGLSKVEVSVDRLTEYPEIPWYAREYSTAPKVDVSWPNGCRLAVVIHCSFEVWSELMDPTITAFRSAQTEFAAPPSGVPASFDFFSASTHDYGGRVGVYRMLRLYEKHRLRGTFSISGLATDRYPDAVKEIAAAGHDIAAHGWTQDIRHSMMSPELQHDEIRRCVHALEALTGRRPTGWISPGGGGTEHLLELLVEEGFEWIGDPKNDDDPYFMDVNGRRLVVIASKSGRTSVNDVELYRGVQPRDLFHKFVDEFDQLYEESLTSPKIVFAATHAELQVPNNTRMWDEMIKYARQFPGVWFTTRGEVARRLLDAHK